MAMKQPFKVSWLNRSMSDMWVEREFDSLHAAARFAREKGSSAHVTV